MTVVTTITRSGSRVGSRTGQGTGLNRGLKIFFLCQLEGFNFRPGADFGAHNRHRRPNRDICYLKTIYDPLFGVLFQEER